MTQNQIIIVILDDLFLVNVVMDAHAIYKHFYLCSVRSLKQIEKLFPNGVINNITLLNNDILVQLNEINHASNIGFVQILDIVNGLVGQMDLLFHTHLSDKLANLLFWELVETNTNKFVLQRKFNLANIIANQEKFNIVPTGLKQILERLLGVFGHVIDFVENHEFVPRFEQVLGFHELVDLVPNNIDASLVGCIQMDDLAFGFFHALVLVDQIDNRGRFAGSGWTVEQQIGKILVFNHICKKDFVIGVEHNVVESTWTILFGPGDIFVH